MKNLLIYGAGGLGSEILELVKMSNAMHERWNIVGFVDDGATTGTIKDGLLVVGKIDYFDSILEPTDIVFALASVNAKETIYNKLKENKFLDFPPLAHHTAVIADSAVLEKGAIVTAMCFISTNTKLGKFSFVNVGSLIGHDTVIGDFCSIMPSANVCGNVIVGDKTFIGVGALIHQGLTIGNSATIGMGSVVTQNIQDNGKVIARPAILLSE